MKKIITLILILIAFTNCTDNDDDKASPVVGTWKLVKTRGWYVSYDDDGKLEDHFTDYSDKNITYRFDANSNLTINTDGKIENHKYEYKLDYLSGSPGPEEGKEFFVFIDDSKWTYFVSDQGEMVLGKSYVDGTDLYFVRQ